MNASRLGRILKMLLALAILVGGYGSMAAHAESALNGSAAVIVSAHEDVHEHGHSHDLDDEGTAAGHEHKHNPFDHSHDVPTAALSSAVLAVPPRMREVPREDHDLIAVAGSALERPPRHAGRS